MRRQLSFFVCLLLEAFHCMTINEGSMEHYEIYPVESFQRHGFYEDLPIDADIQPLFGDAYIHHGPSYDVAEPPVEPILSQHLHAQPRYPRHGPSPPRPPMAAPLPVKKPDVKAKASAPKPDCKETPKKMTQRVEPQKNSGTQAYTVPSVGTKNEQRSGRIEPQKMSGAQGYTVSSAGTRHTHKFQGTEHQNKQGYIVPSAGKMNTHELVPKTPRVKPHIKTPQSHLGKQPVTFNHLPPVFKTGLSRLLQKLSQSEAGQQILNKLDIIQHQTTATSHKQMSLTPMKTERLLRLLSGLKTSNSGRELIHQLRLTEFLGLPEPPLKLDAAGKGMLHYDVPRKLDFSSYNYNGGGRCVDELMRKTMNRYPGRSFLDDVYGRVPGYVTTEMDMVLTGEQWRDFYGNLPLPRSHRGKRSSEDPPPLLRTKRKAIKHSRYYWPDGVVPYLLDENEFNWSDVMLFERAMYEWELASCVRFRQATSSDVNKIRFRSGLGCSSHVGMIGGTQNITLQGPCRIRRIVLHEVGHALGLVHEHQRPDRDDFIQILYENARPGTEWDFKKRTWGTVVNHTVGYDYSSVMHYGPKAFSMDQTKPTIITRNAMYQDSIGKVTELSFDDKKLVNLMYKCARHCPDTINCQHNGYVNKECKCVCPPSHPNCEVVQRTTVTTSRQQKEPELNWMQLFQAFSWSALNALGITNNGFTSNIVRPSTPTRPPKVRLPQTGYNGNIRDIMEAYDSPTSSRSRPQRGPNFRQQTGINMPQQRRIRQHRIVPFSQRFHRQKRHVEKPNHRFRRNALRRRRYRPRYWRSRFYNRRPSIFRSIRYDLNRNRRLPRRNRSFFRNLSENEHEARLREIRYNNRRRNLEKNWSH